MVAVRLVVVVHVAVVEVHVPCVGRVTGVRGARPIVVGLDPRKRILDPISFPVQRPKPSHGTTRCRSPGRGTAP